MMDLARTVTIAGAAGLSFFGDVPQVDGQDPVLRYPRPIGEAAATALALCGDVASEIWYRRTGQRQRVRVDVRRAAAALVSFAVQRLEPNARATLDQWEQSAAGWHAWGWRSFLRGENASNPAVNIYRCQDGRWIHLHGGFPHLAERITTVLHCEGPKIPDAVARWQSTDLEEALALAATCGVVARGVEEWADHPQGRRLCNRPAVEVLRVGDAPPQPWIPGPEPLSGVRVLDLTHVLAGPTCGRTLAQHGAEVLHIAAPGRPFSEAFVVDTGHGKRSTTLDLNRAHGRAALRALLASADIFCQGYRSGAIAGRGFDVAQAMALRPGLVYVSINCYGHDGPWVDRRGWEGLAQVGTGFAIASGPFEKPRLAPAAVCDYLSGYLAARGVMEALARRAVEGGSWHVKVSLFQTGMWLTRLGAGIDESLAPLEPPDFADLLVRQETPYGLLYHLPPALEMDITPPRWKSPPPLLGADAPVWRDAGSSDAYTGAC
jgi:crotonobetainyl-CoA:carnitine CoA-transferase CaiB-like acyl-CoA transferase